MGWGLGESAARRAAPLVSALATIVDEANAREECHERHGELKCKSEKGD
jgi:hypothetical protein